MTFNLRVRITKTPLVPNANKIGAWCHAGKRKALEINVRYFNFKDIEKYVNINILHIV